MGEHSNKKCKHCKYRASEQALNGCDYSMITGKLRGGKASECTKHERGEKIKTHKRFTLD